MRDQSCTQHQGMTGDPEIFATDGSFSQAQRCCLPSVRAVNLKAIHRKHLHLPGQSLELELHRSAAWTAGLSLQLLNPIRKRRSEIIDQCAQPSGAAAA